VALGLLNLRVSHHARTRYAVSSATRSLPALDLGPLALNFSSSLRCSLLRYAFVAYTVVFGAVPVFLCAFGLPHTSL
jgi:hypothetical protein